MAVELQSLGQDECVALLRTAAIGRVGITLGALPVVLPVNFAVVGDAIVLRTVPGTKFHAATSGAVVAFEADGYAPDGAEGWSVLVQGMTSEVKDADELERAHAARIPSWALDGAADRFIRIEMARVSGRRFARSASSTA